MELSTNNKLKKFIYNSSPNDVSNITFIFDNIGSGTHREYPGIAHCIEHMIFKGNKSGIDISQRLTELTGGLFNAYTAYNKTVFQVETKNILPTIELLITMLSEPSFAKTEVEKEKTVIEHELNLFLDNPIAHVVNLMSKSYTVGNKPVMSHDYIAQKNYLPNLNRETLIKVFNEKYSPDNCTLIISGNVNEQTLEDINSKIQKWNTKTSNDNNNIITCDYKPNIHLENAKTNSIYVSMFFNGPKSNDVSNTVNMYLLNTILGTGLNSYFMKNIRVEKNLTYEISSFALQEKDHGIWGITTSTDKKHLQDLLSSLKSQVKNLSKDIIKEDSIAVAKSLLLQTIDLPPASPKIATTNSMFFNEVGVTKTELKSIINNTSCESMKNWYEKMINTGMSLALYGDVSESEYASLNINTTW